MDCSLPGSSIHGIFQATVLEWGAIAFSHAFLWGLSRRTFLLQVWFLITWRHAVKGTRVWKVRAQACCL